MFRLDNVYNTLFSKPTYFGKWRKSASKETKVTKDKAQLAAEKLIRETPKSAIGYLASGELYKKQNNLVAALSIYKQGIRFVPVNDAQHATLQKEKQAVSATLNERNPGFHQLLPYDILCLIFRMVGFRDLLKCTGVCQAWCNFMIEWPEFWQKLSDEMPQIQRSTLDPLIRRQAQEFRLDGPMDDGLLRDILIFLSYSDNHSIQKLSLNKISFNDENAELLASALQSTSPAVRRAEFSNCSIPIAKYISPVLSACSSIEHVSFSQSSPSQSTYSMAAPRKSRVILPAAEFSSLTYLKLTFPSRVDDYPAIRETGCLSGIIRRSPNLVHLFLDSGGRIHQGQCLLEALKYCPRLQNLVVSDCAQMPTTLMSSICDSDYQSPDQNDPPSSSSQPAVVQGVRRLVLSGGNIKMEKGTVSSILKRVYKTLELLYVHYDGTKVTPSSFYRLAYHGAPRLREIRMSTENSCGCGAGEPPISKALAALFSWCPVLEVLEINDTFSSFGTYSSSSYLDVDDETLKAIAENCKRIRHINIRGTSAHTSKGMLNFAEVGGKSLTHLKINLNNAIILEIVKKLQALQSLHCWANPGSIDREERSTAEQILRERGGRLTFGS